MAAGTWPDTVAPRVIVLNGGSSSGKSGIARCLQALLLPDTWLTFGVDTLIEAMPAALRGSDSGLGIAFGADGEVAVGAGSGRWTRRGPAASGRWHVRGPG